jgi:hypothetical protein
VINVEICDICKTRALVAEFSFALSSSTTIGTLISVLGLSVGLVGAQVTTSDVPPSLTHVSAVVTLPKFFVKQSKSA